MKRLKNKKIYYIITGAKKAELADYIIKEMISEGAEVFTIPTKAALDFVDLEKLASIKGNTVKNDWSDKIKLPQEDVVLIAPCTLNTLNTIAAGLANTYPLCLVASSLGNKIPIFIAPAMNLNLWEHPLTKESIKKLEQWGCQIIWPEISKSGVTMMAVEKILDNLYFNFSRVNYLSNKIIDDKLGKKLLEYQAKYFEIFKSLGESLCFNKFNSLTAGCLSIKVPEGILITTSGSDMMKLKAKNLSLILSWNENNNNITYVGDSLPSSESPLHCVLHKNHQHKMILHVHCPEMTYSENLDKYKTSNYLRYGTFSIGQAISKIIKKENFAIMKFHGQVVIGDDTNELLNILWKFKKLI